MSQLTTLFQLWANGGSATVYGLTSTLHKCPVCGQGNVGRENWEQAKVDLISKDAEIYSDWIGGLETLINRKVWDDLKSAGIKGYEAHPVTILDIESPILKKKETPEYFILEPLGRVDLDRNIFDEFDGDLCEFCHKWTPRKGGKYRFGEKMTVPVLETWDGLDLVKTNNIKSGRSYCSQRIIDLAHERQWTGFSARGCTGHLQVNHMSLSWLAEFEANARVKYPQFF
jgi:hypothetical protein